MLSLSSELFSKPDENSLGTTDVAESICVLILNHFADELRAQFGEPSERVVYVFHSEHDAQITERVHRCGPVIGDHGRGDESRKLEPTVAVWRDQHGNLDVLLTQPGDAPGPLSFNRGAAFESQAELDEKWDDGIERFYHDADVVHTLYGHDVSLVPNSLNLAASESYEYQSPST